MAPSKLLTARPPWRGFEAEWDIVEKALDLAEERAKSFDNLVYGIFAGGLLGSTIILALLLALET